MIGVTLQSGLHDALVFLCNRPGRSSQRHGKEQVALAPSIKHLPHLQEAWAVTRGHQRPVKACMGFSPGVAEPRHVALFTFRRTGQSVMGGNEAIVPTHIAGSDTPRREARKGGKAKRRLLFVNKKKQKTFTMPGHGQCRRQRPCPSIVKVFCAAFF